MRIKSTKGMEQRILNSSRHVKDPFSCKDKWDRYFGNRNPLHAELGMGRGDFLIAAASGNPGINFIGIEKYSMVIARAAGKFENTDIRNAALVVADFKDIIEITGEKTIERIYFNFPDPWPKNKHEKRRCTNGRFLSLCKKVMTQPGEIHLKTDNDDFYRYSLNSFVKSGYRILSATDDLYGSSGADGNIQTEYERKFVSLGMKIKKIIAGSD